MSEKSIFNTTGAIINGQLFRVMDFPFEKLENEGPHILRKAIAYRFVGGLIQWLLPYRGIVKKNDYIDESTADVGVYLKEKPKNGYQIRLVLPRTKTERAEYSLEKERDILSATLDQEDQLEQFVEYHVDPDALTDSFKPPLYADDDPLNKLMKLAIRSKDAPFEIYGKRLESLATTKKGTESLNSKNNARRSLKNNRNMSPSKFMTFSKVWQLEPAFILRDAPNAMDKMFDDGTMLIVYPTGNEFEIDPDKLVNINELINPDMYKNDRLSDDDDDTEQDNT